MRLNRKWLLIPLAVVVAFALVLFALEPEQRAAIATAIGLTSAPPPAAQRAKPVCSQAIVPAGADCIPQHMANLPPDPGEAGKATIDGIDSDKDGVRDDVQRFIHETWPDSERARQVLFLMAKNKQSAVHYGGDLSKEETRKFMPEIMNRVICYSRVGGEGLQQQSAMEAVQNKVMNTPERWARAADFSYQLAHHTYELPDDSNISALCGFDPSALPN